MVFSSLFGLRIDEQIYLSMNAYQPRLIDKLLSLKLRSIGAVLIQGPKACGKTTTAKQLARSSLLLSSAQAREAASTTLDMDPKLVLSGDTPRLIDEWQTIPRIWDEVRSELDERGEFGQFILTGSAVPADRTEIFHSGTGRFAWLTMRPMSLFESGVSSATVSLDALFSGENKIFAPNTLGVRELSALVCRGGWPQSVHLQEPDALEYVRSYFEAVVNNDVSRVDGVRRDPERVASLLRSCARSIGTQMSLAQLEQDIAATEGAVEMKIFSISTYMKALKEIFVLEDMPAWNPNLRSKTAIRTTSTRYFADPSIAAAALRIGPQDLLKDLKTFGFLFENLCIRDLRVYADALRADVFHYRDKNNLECDAVIHRQDGAFGLVEIKLGGQENIEHGAKTLKELAGKLAMPKPAFLMVLVGAGQFAYRREDGVFVVPIGCLGP